VPVSIQSEVIVQIEPERLLVCDRPGVELMGIVERLRELFINVLPVDLNRGLAGDVGWWTTYDFRDGRRHGSDKGQLSTCTIQRGVTERLPCVAYERNSRNDLLDISRMISEEKKLQEVLRRR